MLSFMIIGIIVGVMFFGVSVLRRSPRSTTTTPFSVIVDVRGYRIALPQWAWDEVSASLTVAERTDFECAYRRVSRAYDYDYEDTQTIGRVNDAAWNWLITTDQGRQWLQKHYPQLMP